MTREEAIAIIHKEILCVDRDCDIEKNCSKCDLVMPSKEPILEAYKIAIKALEQTRWIPVSERIPDASDYCLCCDKSGYITIGFVAEYSKQWCFDDDEVDIDVIAWMPLPEPYKEESEE